jgi:hypothetical protein
MISSAHFGRFGWRETMRGWSVAARITGKGAIINEACPRRRD